MLGEASLEGGANCRKVSILAPIDKDLKYQVEHFANDFEWPLCFRTTIRDGAGSHPRPGRGCTLGFTVSTGHAGQQLYLKIGSFTQNAKHLVSILNMIFRKIVLAVPAFTWTSIQVNFNTVAVKHRDENNAGPSLAFAVGSYVGGELCIQPQSAVNGVSPTQEFNLLEHPVMFDGRQGHSSKPFRGNRVSFIAFTHASWKEATDEQMLQLIQLGFVVPKHHITTALTLQILLGLRFRAQIPSRTCRSTKGLVGLSAAWCPTLRWEARVRRCGRRC